MAGDEQRATGRSLADFGTLSAAEATLLRCSRSGEAAVIADKRPDAETDANRIRAGFVRFLALGGDERAPVHEHGVQVEGAWITGPLDLNYTDLPRALSIANSRLERVAATGATLSSLILHGTRIEKEFASFNLTCATSIYLCHGFEVNGELSLIGATIAGDLFCGEGRFDNKDGNALALPGLSVGRTLTLPGGRSIIGAADLTDAKVNALADDASTWQGAQKRLKLDGFVYARLTGNAAAGDVAARLRWLDGQVPEHLNADFRNQPWDQLSQVLRAMGQPAAARRIAIEKQKRLRKAGKVPFGGRTLHWLYGAVVGFGYRPSRLFFTLAGFWLLFAAIYSSGGGAFQSTAPNTAAKDGAPASERPPPAAGFDAALYSLDVLLPIDLDIQKAWRPTAATMRWLVTAETIIGWLGTLLALGALGNLLKKD